MRGKAIRNHVMGSLEEKLLMYSKAEVHYVL
jgi:hypothetical protein